MAYCRNCGFQMDDAAAVCIKCGTLKGQGNSFCSNCGQATQAGTAFCISCGAAVNQAVADNSNKKSKIAAGLLGIFLGAFGVHNFYLGNTGKAVAQLLISVLSCFFLSPISSTWGLIEGILILCGNINTDGNGNPLGD